jgi:hypothetical protein
MGIAEKIQKLVRLVPGVTGYQDSDSARETDKAVRMRLANEIEKIRLDLESEKHRLVDIKDFALLPDLDGISSKLDKSANTIKYAARGFSGIFDKPRVNVQRLEKLCSFDLGLLGDIENLKTLLKSVHDSNSDSASLKIAIGKMDGAVEELGRKFSTRQDILDAPD